MQVHYDIWRHPADVQARQPVGRSSSSLAYRLLPQSLQDAYADETARLAGAGNGQVRAYCNIIPNIGVLDRIPIAIKYTKYPTYSTTPNIKALYIT